MVIELCETNEARELIGQIRASHPTADIVVHPCLNRCNACLLALFAFVDGELLEAYSPEQLLDKIKACR
ncbi:DUF1450 domain-containing protein [Effusibacillus pohliae]|uniref:DUF1450 domain-containing protein n=1 Tax=Effusibacillus pohliae TaxID=232270 RepID=UPI0003613C80|nr:DUF1450 domain-containing protein [Effusibacillus pohliae]